MGWIIWTIAGVYILYKLFPGEKPKGRLDREFKDRIPRESRSSTNSLYDIHSRASKSKPQKRAHKQNIADWHMPGEVQKIGPLTLTGGFYYYGDHLPSTRGYYGTDEHKAYSQLKKDYIHHSVEHSKEFATIDGVHNNQAESFFSRLRRSEYGVYHGCRTPYILDYAQEAAWREDNRRVSLKDQFKGLVTSIMGLGESVWWRGYFQGNRRTDELFNF